MENITAHERVQRILERKPTDRVAVYETFWGDTARAWTASGHLEPDESLIAHFGLDMHRAGCPNLMADLDHRRTVLDEDDRTVLIKDGNGALLRQWKHKAGTPEHVDFEVKDRRSWETKVKPFLLDDSRIRERIPFTEYRGAKEFCRQRDLYFMVDAIHIFERMHPVCGHEYMLMGMLEDPDWIRDMCQVFTDLMLKIQELLFAEEGVPDGVWYAEDLGFKQKPFMSPAMYRELLQPYHKRTFDFAHSYGLKVILHSCGFVEPLLPGLIEAGIDCLQAIEVKAGMDLVHLKQRFGDRIALMGGMDIRALETNDRARVEEELTAKLPEAMQNSGYILHSDHSISSRVEHDTYAFFVDKGRELGAYGTLR